MDILHTLIYQPLFNVLVILYNTLGSNLGLAIIALSIVFKLVTSPITSFQNKMATGNKEQMDKINEIQKKYKDDPDKLASEMMKYQPAVMKSVGKGCAFTIILILMFVQLRHVIVDFSATEVINENNQTVERNIGWKNFNKVAYTDKLEHGDYDTVNPMFLGLDIGKTARDFMGGGIESLFTIQTLPYLLLALLVGATQFWLMKLSVQNSADLAKDQKLGIEDAEIVSIAKEKKNKDGKKNLSAVELDSTKPESVSPENMANIFGGQMNIMFSVLTTVTSLGFLGGAQFFPSGLSIFWTIQNIGSIIEKLFQNRKK